MKILVFVVAITITLVASSMGTSAGLLPLQIVTPDDAPLVVTQAAAWLKPYPHPLLLDGKRADHVSSLALSVGQVRNVTDKAITAFELQARASNPFGDDIPLRNIHVVSAWSTAWTDAISTVSDTNAYIHVPPRPLLKGSAYLGLTYWIYRGTIGRVSVAVSRVKFSDGTVWQSGGEPATVPASQRGGPART
jgi:hypothetical protein